MGGEGPRTKRGTGSLRWYGSQGFIRLFLSNEFCTVSGKSEENVLNHAWDMYTIHSQELREVCFQYKITTEIELDFLPITNEYCRQIHKQLQHVDLKRLRNPLKPFIPCVPIPCFPSRSQRKDDIWRCFDGVCGYHSPTSMCPYNAMSHTDKTCSTQAAVVL